MRKRYAIIFMCILSGCIFLVSDFYYTWFQFSLAAETQIDFVSWLISNAGLGYLFEALGDLGICLIGSSVFLIMVNWTIANAEKRIVDATNLERKRHEIAREMRYLPKQTIEIYRNSGSTSDLFINQFFQGCKWCGLTLDSLNFSKSDFTNCDFTNSSLVDVNLSYCILSGAIFKNAKLTCTNFKGSNVSEEQLRAAYSLWNSIMPNGDKYDGRFMLPGDIREASQYGYDILNDEKARAAYFSKGEK